MRRSIALIGSVIIAAAIPLGAQSADPSILIGANSIEYAGGSPPNCFGPSVLYDYGQSAVRHRVQAQLAAMAASGLDSLRVFLSSTTTFPKISTSFPRERVSSKSHSNRT